MTQKENKNIVARDLALFGNVRVLCVAALLCALSFVLAWFAKLLQGVGPLRFTVENLPIIFAGMIFGPGIGAVVGVGADMLSCLVAGQTINPLITIGVGAIGLISGIVGDIFHKRIGKLPIVFAEGLSHLIGSVIIKTWALHTFGYEWSLLIWRFPIYIGIAFCESMILYFLFHHPAVMKELCKLTSVGNTTHNKCNSSPSSTHMLDPTEDEHTKEGDAQQ